jgi:hypothetical protein
MARLFGREVTRKELLSFTGNLAQVGGIRPVELASGRERGVRAFDVTTGSGLQFSVLADRALDIAGVSFRGRALAYLTPGGAAHPAFYEPQGAGWLRTFPGGLLTTCGMAAVGSPCSDAGETTGLHGRISALPVEELGFWGEWHGDDYWMHITGSITEGVIFGNPLRLSRHITARLGDNTIVLHDTVENLGGEPAPHMMLYHMNFGWPLLSPASKLITNSTAVTPVTEIAAKGLAAHAEFEEPVPGFPEQVFYHDTVGDTKGDARVALVNPTLDGGLGVGITYHKKTLTRLVQWKQMGYGTYVLGLEPANCGVEGRDVERARGTLQVLQPGETRDYHLAVTVLDGPSEIEAFTGLIR